MKPGDLNAGTIRITNWYEFTDLNTQVDGTWRTVGDGKTIQKGTMTGLDISPRASRVATLPIELFPPAAGANSETATSTVIGL